MTLFGAEQTQATSDDYYTPAWIFDRMGIRFDLDVCAPPSGVPWVPADRFYTMADDGLSQPWVGRVWMNPPYSKPKPWVERFMEHRNGVALVPFAKSAWFFDLWRSVDAMCAPGVDMSKFVGGPIFMPTVLAAYEHRLNPVTLDVERRWVTRFNRLRTHDFHFIKVLRREPTWTFVLVGRRVRTWGYLEETDDLNDVVPFGQMWTWTEFSGHRYNAEFEDALAKRKARA